MREVVIKYTDFEGLARDRECQYEAGPYDYDKAKQVSANLAMMGCRDIFFVAAEKT